MVGATKDTLRARGAQAIEHLPDRLARTFEPECDRIGERRSCPRARERR